MFFDLDDTLISTTSEQPFEETEMILALAKQMKFIVVLVSYNQEAETILQTHHLYNYFTGIVCGSNDGTHKISLLMTACAKAGLCDSDRVYFFDDLAENIQSAIQLGMCAFRCDPKTGFKLDEFKKIIAM